eukprot:13581823-Heterocapsa_arctica.AAC.1
MQHAFRAPAAPARCVAIPAPAVLARAFAVPGADADNTVAPLVFTRGYSKHAAGNAFVAAYWAAVARTSAAP